MTMSSTAILTRAGWTVTLALFLSAPMNHALVGQAHADPFTPVLLTDQTGYTTTIGQGFVDRVDFGSLYAPAIFYQRFYYRVGDSGGERPVADLALLRTPIVSTAQDGRTIAVDFLFGDPADQFKIGLQFISAGGDQVKTQFINMITVANTSGLAATPLDFHLYLATYANLDINNSPESSLDYDSVTLLDPATIKQTSPLGAAAFTYVTSGPQPDGYRITTRPYDISSPSGTTHIDPLGGALGDANPTTFTPIPAYFPVQGSVYPPIGMQWAWEWDLSIPYGGQTGPSSEFISLYNVVAVVEAPEPSSASVLLVAVLSLFGRLYWRRLRPAGATGPM